MSQPARNLDRQSRAPRRVGIVSRRSLSEQAFHATLYEAEDVLTDTGNIDLIDIQAGRIYPLKSKWQKRLLFRNVSPKLAYVNPGLQSLRLTNHYDLLIVFCQNIWDLIHFNALEGWRDRSSTTVFWLEEFWAAEISKFPDLFRSLERFDHIALCSKGSVGPLSEFLGRKCHWVPIAVDMLRFSPFPKWPERAIDVFSMGRRWEGVHSALLDAAAKQDLFYVHDTGRGMAEVRLVSHRQHRDHYANLAKRSKYFMVAPAKMNVADETLGQVEVGFRYFEGTAAGSVLLGQAPDCEAFQDNFPWPGAVVQIKPDGSDVVSVIAGLEATPEKVARISRRNVAEALRRHDWVHRWIKIFEIAGLEPSAGMVARVERMKALAEVALHATAPSTETSAKVSTHQIDDRRVELR